MIILIAFCLFGFTAAAPFNLLSETLVPSTYNYGGINSEDLLLFPPSQLLLLKALNTRQLLLENSLYDEAVNLNNNLYDQVIPLQRFIGQQFNTPQYITTPQSRKFSYNLNTIPNQFEIGSYPNENQVGRLRVKHSQDDEDYTFPPLRERVENINYVFNGM